LALQSALDLGARGRKSLVLLSEEHVSRVRDRAERMVSGGPKADAKASLRNLALLAAPDDPADLPAYVARHVIAADAAHTGVALVVLDSIQGTTGAGGSDARACRAALDAARLLQSAGIATLLVGHVTKQNAIRGPRTLEHAVDVVLHLDRRGGRRTLTVPKNRFGPAVLRPTNLIVDPVTTRLVAAPHATSQIATAKSFVPGVGPVELQVAAALPAVGTAGGGRILACRGIAAAEVRMAAEILRRLPGFDAIVPDLDLTVTCRWPDQRGAPAGAAARSLLQLPLCLAIAGACLGRAVDPSMAAVGELDLSGHVRGFTPAVLRSMGTALHTDELSELFLLVPAASKKQLPSNCSCPIWGVGTLAEAMARLWPALDLNALAWNC
jgi:DNA repair protein RadA/Sms